MFKVGDIVYCVDNYYTAGKSTSSILSSIEKDKPYTIIHVVNGYIIQYYLKEIQNKVFSENRFISEIEYKKSLRKEKINKINKI